MQKSGITANMAAFEKVFEDLDVTAEGLTGAMDAVVGQSAADQNEVQQLLQQMQAEAGLQANLGIGNAAQNKIAGQQQQVAEQDDMQEMEKRLAALR